VSELAKVEKDVAEGKLRQNHYIDTMAARLLVDALEAEGKASFARARHGLETGGMSL